MYSATLRIATLGLALCAAMAWGCSGEKSDPPASSTKTVTEKKGESKPGKASASYRLKVTGPPTGKVGDTVQATVQLVPQGEYKINMEYPLRLTVKTAKGSQVVLRAKDAKKMTKAEVLLLPAAKLESKGVHKYTADFRFSVCTEKQCELKRKELHWVAKAQ